MFNSYIFLLKKTCIPEEFQTYVGSARSFMAHAEGVFDLRVQQSEEGGGGGRAADTCCKKSACNLCNTPVLSIATPPSSESCVCMFEER